MRTALLVVCAVLALTAGLVFAAVERTLPATDATVRLQGLHAEVDVGFDRFGIPRIRAADEQDAAEALGFLHARDRMMQMDLMRRAAAGELSELIGPATLPVDRTMRLLGVRQAAENSLASLPQATRGLLEAYSRGVNAFITERGRFAAPEYLVLGRPRPWQPLDCIMWAETMGLFLSDNLILELQRLSLSDHLSPDAVLSLWPTSTPAPVDQAARDTPEATALARATLGVLPHFPQPFTLPDTASNEWAVDGRHTVTGAPLLAGDPHLSYGLPCLWYLARIDTPGFSAAGATAPGTPFIVLGHNRYVAWTFTTTGADTEDLFLEHTTDAAHYQTPTGPEPFVHRTERIHVRGRPDVVLDVRLTRHGPVISDLPTFFGVPVPKNGMIAAEIASLLPGNRAAFGLDQLEHAASVADAGRAAPALTAPVQNLLVADRSGIGLFTTGRVPIRRSGDGRLPAPGWDGSHDWTGFASGADLPVSTDPPTGILVNANEPVEGTGSTVLLSRDNFADWRSRRIRQLLASPRRFGTDDFTAMQGDVTSAYIASLLPILRTAHPNDHASKAALQLLGGWDGTMAADEPQPLLIAAWLAAITRGLVHAAADDDARAVAPLAYVSAALTSCSPPCEQLLSSTLASAVAQLQAADGSDPRAWRWGHAHKAIFNNPVWGNIPIVRSLLEASLPVGGDASTVDAQGSASSGPSFSSVHGASFRGVYNLANLDQSRFVIATGQSGNPFSPHLLDLSKRWQHDQTITIGAFAGTDGDHLRLAPVTN